MNVTVIISVYKDVESLSLIIDSLLKQTVTVDEIIISEDGDSIEIKNYFNSLKHKRIRHLFQEDNGWQKNKALNRAVRASKNDYLIFIDGDCLPYPSFVESNILLSEKNNVLCGRRTEPGEYISRQIKDRKISINQFIQNYLQNYFKLRADNIRHYDDGLYFHPNSFIFNSIKKLRTNKKNHILGCNFSCWKEDLEKINGFDEDFNLPTTGEDTDIERRMKHFGIKMKSCRYSANVIHLYHKKVFNREISAKTEAIMESKKDIFICERGLINDSDK